MKLDLHYEIDIPEGVEVEIIDKGNMTVKGPKGTNTRTFKDALVKFKVEDRKVILDVPKATKREKSRIITYTKHIHNMINGTTEGFTYKLKVCSGHFPMAATVSNNQFTIKNFIGEKCPRTIPIKEGADVKVDGDTITVESVNKEICGQVAADIESLTRIRDKDRRIFQDGIYIIEKNGKAI